MGQSVFNCAQLDCGETYQNFELCCGHNKSKEPNAYKTINSEFDDAADL